MMTSLRALVVGALACLLGCHSSNGSTSNSDGGVPDLRSSANHDLSGCAPMCGAKVCGMDACGGSCGTCAQTSMCDSGGMCQPVASGTIVVDATATNGNIHPEVYGLAFASKETLTALNVPLNRRGGNSTTRYNWQLDVHNVAFDYYFENIADSGSGTYGQSNFVSSADQLVLDSKAANAATLMTIPTIGWAPKDRVDAHPFTCGYPVSKYGAQDSVDPYDTNCGNGKHSGKQIAGDPTNTSVAAPPAFEAAWLKHLTDKFSTADKGGIQYYQLDNEMMLWSSTHIDVHPSPVTTDEMWKTVTDYAPVIRAADPSAYILGYGAWSILDLINSAVDTANQNTNDQAAHGGVPIAQWYLRQLAAYEKTNGTRLVDCLDVHYYPMGGSSLENTRSLWDSTYPDPSWVNGFLGEPVQLIPRMQGWIKTEYPGTDVCVSEYNFDLNNETDPNSAIAEADVLGIYGKYGVRLAAYWTTPVDDNGKPLAPYYAFQMYRNYDGAGGTFGSVSIGAATMIDQMGVYAATDATTSTVTVVVTNKQGTAVNTTLELQHFAPAANAHVYQYVATAGAKLTKLADVTVANSKATLTLPSHSMTLIVLPKQ